MFIKLSNFKPLTSNFRSFSRSVFTQRKDTPYISTQNKAADQADILSKSLSFRKYKLLPEIINVLENTLNVTSPSPIQQMAIPHLIQGKSALLAAQTGTGKTLAYTLPIIHQLKQQEMRAQTRLTIPFKPRSLILVPNRELAIQVHEDALKPFHYEIPLKFFSIYSGQSHRIETDKLTDGVDVLVSTLERFIYRREGDKVFLSNVGSLVIDEFDTFLDAGNEDKLREIINQFLSTEQKQGIKKQIIFSSATVTSQMDGILKDYFTDDKDFKQLIERRTHMNLSHLKHEFIQLADFDKIKPLKILVKEFRQYAQKNKTSCIIFCNSVQSARAIEHALKDDGEKTASLHGEIPPKMRMNNFDRFKDRKADILVATDLASRGLDLPFVSHIINFDFPKSTSDYLHRAGRAGRAGRPGFVLSLVREKDSAILEEMRLSNENQEPLKIKGSAFSLKNKEKLIEMRKKEGVRPQLGLKDKGNGPLYKGNQLALRKNNNISESKTFKEMRQARNDKSLKIKKEKDRVLYMKSKPLRAKKTFEDGRKDSLKERARRFARRK